MATETVQTIYLYQGLGKTDSKTQLDDCHVPAYIPARRRNVIIDYSEWR